MLRMKINFPFSGANTVFHIFRIQKLKETVYI